jgi:hypothetical protein
MTSTRPSSVINEIRVLLYGVAQILIPTRTVTIKPSAQAFFTFCSGLDLNDKKAITLRFANEMFKVSNAPTLQECRDAIWKGKNPDGTEGGARSLSVGDAVVVDFCDGIQMVAICLPSGWFASSIGDNVPGANDGMVMRDFMSLLESAETSWDRQDLVRTLEETEES